MKPRKGGKDEEEEREKKTHSFSMTQRLKRKGKEKKEKEKRNKAEWSLGVFSEDCGQELRTRIEDTVGCDSVTASLFNTTRKQRGGNASGFCSNLSYLLFVNGSGGAAICPGVTCLKAGIPVQSRRLYSYSPDHVRPFKLVFFVTFRPCLACRDEDTR